MTIVLARALPAAGQGAPDYSANTIVDHFAKKVEAQSALPGAKTRSVYLGASGFSAADEGKAEDDRFNLLITFEYNSDTLTGGARRNLDEFARALSDPRLKSARFMIEGHTDATGPADYNMALSQRRAAAVVSYLVAHGIDPARLRAKGYGETRLKSDRPDDQINRRVETRLIQ